MIFRLQYVGPASCARHAYSAASHLHWRARFVSPTSGVPLIPQ